MLARTMQRHLLFLFSKLFCCWFILQLERAICYVAYCFLRVKSSSLKRIVSQELKPGMDTYNNNISDELKTFFPVKLIFYDIISANEASLIVSFRRNFLFLSLVLCVKPIQQMTDSSFRLLENDNDNDDIPRTNPKYKKKHTWKHQRRKMFRRCRTLKRV